MSSHKLRAEVADRASVRGVASAYNGAGMNYAAYADGDSDPRKLFSFDGLHAYPDKQVWNLLEAKLRALRAAGANAVSILDAGCGPGTWLRRLVLHARDLGFSSIRARGFDIAEVQIYAARRRAGEFSDLPGVDLKFDVADILAGLPEPPATVDITLCLYSVLSHVAVRALPRALEELARVTRGHFIATVRAIGSTPTIFVDSVDKAAAFKLDYVHDRCLIKFRNGSDIELPFHLFTSEELETRLGMFFEVEDLRGLDIFHNRFAPDHRWNPDSVEADERLLSRLANLEETHTRNPDFIDRANHLLFLGRPRMTNVRKSEPRDIKSISCKAVRDAPSVPAPRDSI